MKYRNLFLTLFVFVISLASFSQSLTPAPSTEATANGWFPRPMQTIDELFALYEYGNQEIQNKFGNLEYQEFIALVEKDKVRIEHPTLGKVNYTMIDGEPVVRMVHKASGTSFMFLDSSRINKESEHLKQYIARQHMFTGADSQKKPGRDVVLMWFQSNIATEEGPTATSMRDQIHAVEFSPRPSTLMSRVREYWRGIYKKPTRDTVIFGLGSAVIQTAMGLGVSALKVAVDPSAPFLMEPAMLNFLFGAVIGAYSSTYRNWVYETNPSMIATTLKGSTISALYAYSLVYMTQGGLSSLSIMDAGGLLLNAHIMSNMILNNWGKQEWTQWARVKTAERMDSNVHQVKLPFVKEPVNVKQRDINYQIYAYLPPQFLRTADLVGITLSLPLLGFPLPLGSIALWTSIPIVKYATLKWAEKYYPETAESMKLRENWNEFKKIPLRLPVKMYQQSLRIIKGTPSVLGNWWQSIAESIPVLNKTVDATKIDPKNEQAWSDLWSELKPEAIRAPVKLRCEALFAN